MTMLHLQKSLRPVIYGQYMHECASLASSCGETRFVSSMQGGSISPRSIALRSSLDKYSTTDVPTQSLKTFTAVRKRSLYKLTSNDQMIL